MAAPKRRSVQLLGQATPKVCNFLSEPLDPLVVDLLDRTAKRHLSLFEEKG